MRAFATGEKAINDMSDGEFEDYLSKQSRTNNRLDRLGGLFGGLNSAGNGLSGGTLGGSNKSTSTSTTSSNLGGFGGLGDFDSLSDKAKDLARFRLGLDKEQSEFSFGLRDKEAEGNFGRQFKLDTNQRQFDRNINTDTQSAMTDRLQKQLNTQLEQQSRDINQQNFATSRAINLASRRLGSRR
jgi:hypothetical protein